MGRFLFLLFLILPVLGFGQEGGAEERETVLGNALAGVLRERNIPFTERKASPEGENPFVSRSNSLEVLIPSQGGAEGEAPGNLFILAVPLKGDLPSPDSLPFHFEAALAFIEKIREGALNTAVQVSFLGNEEAAEGEVQTTGLEDLLSRLDDPEYAALLYLDAAVPARGILIRHGTAQILAPLDILKPLTDQCALYNIPYKFRIRFNELYKLGLALGPLVLRRAQDWDISALYITGDPDAPGPLLSASSFGEFLASYAGSLRIDTENHDYHYTLIRAGERVYYLSEYATVVIFLVAAFVFLFALLIYTTVYRHIPAIQWRIFMRRSWVLPLLIIIIAAAFRLAGAVFSLILRSYALPPGEAPYSAALPAMAFGAALFFLGTPFLDFLPIPRRANFYGNAAVVLIFLGILAAAFLDITFIPVFLWAALFIFLSSVARKTVLIYLFAAIGSFQIIAAAWNLAEIQNSALSSFIFSPSITSALYVALLALPFYSILKRAALLLRARKRRPFTFGVFIPRLVFLALSASSLFFYSAWLSGVTSSVP